MTAKQYGAADDYESKLKRVMERFGASEFDFDWNRKGNCWIRFSTDGEGFYFFHSVEQAKAAGINLKYGSDAFAQLVLTLENEKAQFAETTITTIKETLLQRDENWRDWVKDTMNAIVARLGGGKDRHHELRSRSYQILTDRAECKFDTRLRNLRNRLEERGISKTRINDANKLDVIEEEPRLKEIYTAIIKELSIGSL